MKILKVGIVGCGRVAQHYKTIFNKYLKSKFKIIAVADLDIEKANILGNFFKCKSYMSLIELSNNESPDLIIISTPSGDHFKSIKLSLTLGFNTVTEKPMAMTPKQCEILIKISKKNNLFFNTIFQNRFNPSIEFLKKTVNNKMIGKVITANIRLRWCRFQEYYNDEWHGTWFNDGGAINQQGIHHIDILNYINGPIAEISAFGGNRMNKLEAEDTMVAIIKFTNNSLGTLEITTAARPEDHEASIDIVSEKAYIQIGGIALNKIKNFKVFNNNKYNEKIIKKKYSENVSNGYGFSHFRYFNKVYDFLVKKTIVPPIKLRENLETTKIIHSLYTSWELNRPIALSSNAVSKKLGIKKRGKYGK